jgi:hypothetical protein
MMPVFWWQVPVSMLDGEAERSFLLRQVLSDFTAVSQIVLFFKSLFFNGFNVLFDLRYQIYLINAFVIISLVILLNFYFKILSLSPMFIFTVPTFSILFPPPFLIYSHPPF